MRPSIGGCISCRREVPFHCMNAGIQAVPLLFGQAMGFQAMESAVVMRTALSSIHDSVVAFTKSSWNRLGTVLRVKVPLCWTQCGLRIVLLL